MTSVDAEQLLALARKKTAEGRSALAETISELFSEDTGALSDRERALMFDILHRLVHEAEMSVRTALSERLAGRADAPRDLVRLLANDDVEVAYPVLTGSPVLHDTDLIEVVRQRTLEHQLAIAMRYTLSAEVSDVLVETGNEGVIRTLLQNENARISNETMAFLVEESRRVDSYQEPIVNRRDLDPELAKRIFLWVSAALRKHIVEQFGLDQTTVDDLLEEIAFDQIGGRAGVNGKGPQALADRLHDEGLITPQVMIRALSEGEVNLFAAMFGRLTGLRRTLVMRLLFEPGGEGLAIACKALDFDREQFLTIYTLSRKARPQVESNAGEVRKLRTLYDSMTRAAAEDVRARWRRDSDYLAAIRELELGVPSNG